MKVIQLKLELQIFARKYPNFKSKPIDRFQFVLFTYIFPFWASFREIISYERFLVWKKEGLRKHWADISKPKGGRPAIPWGLIKKIRKISKIDPTWGAEKIQNELAKLGESVSTETVRKYMKKKLPDPKKIARWEHFLRDLKDAIVAIDFFTIHSLWNFNRIFYAFAFISHGERKIIHFNVTEYPTENWISQQIRNAFPFEHDYKYILRDNDVKYTPKVKDTIRSFGLKIKHSSPKSPWQNGFIERWIGSCRRECIDFIFPINNAQIKKRIKEYVDFYNLDRCHQSLEGDSPAGRLIEVPPYKGAKIFAIPKVGGLQHRYTYKKAA